MADEKTLQSLIKEGLQFCTLHQDIHFGCCGMSSPEWKEGLLKSSLF
jgi:hypothetical protein